MHIQTGCDMLQKPNYAAVPRMHIQTGYDMLQKPNYAAVR